MKETFVKTLEETDSYRVDLVDVEVWGERTRMYKLVLKVDGKEIPVQRCHYDFELPDLIERIDNSKGFYCNYGKGHPLAEFSDPLRLFEGGRPFTEVEKRDNVWVFCGNHKEYSGAFRYLIWDRKLAHEVIKRLENERLRAEGG